MAAAAEKTTHITRICIEINNRIQKIKEHLVVKSALLCERDVSFFFEFLYSVISRMTKNHNDFHIETLKQS